jgi:outer membrane immunogenic protein
MKRELLLSSVATSCGHGVHMKKSWLMGSAMAAVLTVPAIAADLPVRAAVSAPVVAPAPVYNWTGCYIGGHVGGGWGQTNWVDRSPGLPDYPDFFFVGGGPSPQSLGEDESGWLAGGHIGCDYQINSWVFGIEGSVSATGITGNETNPFFSAFGNNKTLHTRTDWMASVTPKIGYSWDRWLIYLKGGAAWSHSKYHAYDPVDDASFDQSDTRSGWVIGGGIEYAFAPGWSAFVEYAHYDFGTANLTFSSPTFGATYLPGVNITDRIDVVDVGINFWLNSFMR